MVIQILALVGSFNLSETSNNNQRNYAYEEQLLTVELRVNTIDTYIVNHQQKFMFMPQPNKLSHWCKVSIHTKQAGKENQIEYFPVKPI